MSQRGVRARRQHLVVATLSSSALEWAVWTEGRKCQTQETERRGPEWQMLVHSCRRVLRGHAVVELMSHSDSRVPSVPLRQQTLPRSRIARSIFNLSPRATPRSLRCCSVRSGRTEISILFSAKRSAYPDMPSFLSQSAICCIAGTKVVVEFSGTAIKSVPLTAMARLVKKQRRTGRATSLTMFRPDALALNATCHQRRAQPFPPRS